MKIAILISNPKVSNELGDFLKVSLQLPDLEILTLNNGDSKSGGLMKHLNDTDIVIHEHFENDDIRYALVGYSIGVEYDPAYIEPFEMVSSEIRRKITPSRSGIEF